jgi:hypothetical protein
MARVLRKVKGLAGIDGSDPQLRRGQGTGDQHLQFACRLQHNQHRPECLQAGHQPGDTGLIIRYYPGLGAQPQSYFQL